MTDPLKPHDDSTREFGSGLSRSGDQAMLVRGLGRALGWLLLAVVRGVRWLYDRLLGLRRQSR